MWATAPAAYARLVDGVKAALRTAGFQTQQNTFCTCGLFQFFIIHKTLWPNMNKSLQRQVHMLLATPQALNCNGHALQDMHAAGSFRQLARVQILTYLALATAQIDLAQLCASKRLSWTKRFALQGNAFVERIVRNAAQITHRASLYDDSAGWPAGWRNSQFALRYHCYSCTQQVHIP